MKVFKEYIIYIFPNINKMQLTIDIYMRVNVCRYKDNKPLTPGSRYWINRDGGHCTLTIRDVMESDTGQYTCKIINPAGETSCTGSLELPSNYVAPVHPLVIPRFLHVSHLVTTAFLLLC